MAAPLTRLLRQLHHLAAPPGAASDGELLGRFARCHEEEAFAALVERHGLMVRNVCRRLLGDAHAAEDAFQATFLVLARRAGTIRRPGALAAWLYAVAYRVARKVRAGRARQQAGALPAGDDTAADPSPDPLAQVSAREALVAVEEEVRRLPEAYRLPVALCCLEGLSQEEAARRLGCTAGAVKGRLERGRTRLRQRLQKRGLALAAALAAAEVARGPGPALAAAATAGAAVRFTTGPAGAAGSTRAAALAQGVLRMMLFQRLGSVAALVVLGAACLAAGALSYDRLAAQPPDAQEGAAAASAKADAAGKGRRLWAALSLDQPLYQEGGKGGPRLSFALVNDGDKDIDPQVRSSKMIVNGKVLPAFMRALDRPGDPRYRALPAGDYLLFTVVLGDHFKKVGVYRLAWEGEGFRGAEVVFRVLPGASAGWGGPQNRREAAQALQQRAEARQKEGKVAEAEAAYRQALALQQKLVQEFPNQAAYRTDLAVTLNRLGALHNLTGRPAEAEHTLRQAIALLEKLVADAPDGEVQCKELARSYLQLAAVLQNVGRGRAEVDALRRRAAELLKGLERRAG
jgi:RNA polymerase sigma factor (sigma-70 family)